MFVFGIHDVIFVTLLVLTIVCFGIMKAQDAIRSRRVRRRF